MSNTTNFGNCVFGIHARRFVWNIFIFCLLMELTFLILDAFVNFAELTEIGAIRRLCNLAREDSLSSWFGSIQTLMVGLTLIVIFLRVKKDRSTATWKAVGWCILAIFFIYMAIDDGAEVHERMGTVFKTLNKDEAGAYSEHTIGGKLLRAFPSYAWQVVFLPFFGSMGILMLIFLKKELKVRPAWALAVMGISCFVIAVFMDFVEGMDKEHPWNLHVMLQENYHLRYRTVRHFSKAIEETIEMLGITLFWTAFLLHLSKIAGTIQIQFIHKD